jgi:hypothetical protein
LLNIRLPQEKKLGQLHGFVSGVVGAPDSKMVFQIPSAGEVR